MSTQPSPSTEAERAAPKPALLKTPLSYDRKDFLHSPGGRSIRLLAEFEEFPQRMKRHGIRGTFLFFGSARTPPRDQFESEMAVLKDKVTNPVFSAEEKEKAAGRIDFLNKMEWSLKWMDETEELARLLTEWARTPEGIEVGMSCRTHFPEGNNEEQPLVVCTGGGPGFMLAGNKGAHKAGGLSMGVGVELPWETSLNEYVTDGLNFHFEYFFTRKFWEVYCSKCMVCCPGGMGTLDEMFEVLVLMQTGHCPKMPVVLLGAQFWRDVINFDKLAQYNVISQKEVDALCYADDAKTGFEFIRNYLVNEANERKAQKGTSTPRK